ncbi:Replication protein [Lacticaseibacillus paracasei subsp. paracasei]|uniref:Replication protein n=1 Tax=Lacticaseibacillus paracasei subsp. paracasei TaxID=47714 RepID=A0AAP9HH43_LACPA|nr:protein rep [Lacticaseibacillus paracasei]QGV17965.1 Replication protein [Lacticaseibacillus paracasei subsp. paracasei]
MTDILKDVTSYGKEQPWRERKIACQMYGKYVTKLNYKKATRVVECGETLRFASSGSDLKLFQAWFCHSRLCPMCNWRRARKQSYQLSLIINEALGKNPSGVFLFLTLTEKNATASTLKAELKKMNASFYRLFQYKKTSKNLLGYVRSTEITFNETHHTYHQHAHVLLLMKSTYFRDSQNYITQAEWSRLWKHARKLNYEPVVNVKRVRPNVRRRDTSLAASAREVAKYQVKSTDYLTGNEGRDLKVVDTLENALNHTRQLSFGGVLKDIRQKLKLDDLDNDDNPQNLIQLGINPATGQKVTEVDYVWNPVTSNYEKW